MGYTDYTTPQNFGYICLFNDTGNTGNDTVATPASSNTLGYVWYMNQVGVNTDGRGQGGGNRGEWGNGWITARGIVPDVGWFFFYKMEEVTSNLIIPWTNAPTYITSMGSPAQGIGGPGYNNITLNQPVGVDLYGGTNMYFVPNTLTIPNGTVIPKGSTQFTVNCVSPLFQYRNYNNGIGLYPKVGDTIFIDSMSTPSTITAIQASASNTGWNAVITIKDPTPSDYTAGTQSYAYTWTPGQPPDFKNTPIPPVVPNVPFSYNTLIANSDSASGQYLLRNQLQKAETTTDSGNGAYGRGCLWSANTLPQQSWFLFDLGINGTETHMAYNTQPYYISGTTPGDSTHYNTVTMSQNLSTPIPANSTSFYTPNVLTIPSGTTIPVGSTQFNVTSASPLFSFLNFNNGQGLYPHVGDTIMFDGLNSPTTITAMTPVTYNSDYTTWTVTFTLASGTNKTITTGDNAFCYTWNPNSEPDFYHSVDDDLPHSVPTAPTTPPAPVVPPNQIVPNVPNIPDPPIIQGTFVYTDFQDVINYYNTYYPGFGMTYTPNILAGQPMTLEQVNGFLDALRNCNNGWKGSTAVPDKSHINDGDTKMVMYFKKPEINFVPTYNREFFNSGNGTSANIVTVPAGCQYVHVQWLIAGGGAGGAADGSHDTGGDAFGGNAMGGGAGAYIQDCWIKVLPNDVLTFNIGAGGSPNYGWGGGGWGNPGGTSSLTITRGTSSATPLSVSGGLGGNPNGIGWGFNVDLDGKGGDVLAALGNTGHPGNMASHAESHWGAHHVSNESDGRPGADSPLGSGGYGSGSGNGYGAGGGGAGFVDGSHKHWSSGRAGGGWGSPGYAKVDFVMYPDENATVYDVNF